MEEKLERAGAFNLDLCSECMFGDLPFWTTAERFVFVKKEKNGEFGKTFYLKVGRFLAKIVPTDGTHGFFSENDYGRTLASQSIVISDHIPIKIVGIFQKKEYPRSHAIYVSSKRGRRDEQITCAIIGSQCRVSSPRNDGNCRYP